jgi:hypothetical protein
MRETVPGADAYVLSTWLFLRLLGVVYLVAFVSLDRQILGLVGSRGILPVRELLARRGRRVLPLFLGWPTLAWWASSDRALRAMTRGGAALSILLVAGAAPIPVLALLWFLHLSLVHACGEFLHYQWDVLLLEAGFLAILLAPLEILPSFPPAAAPSPIGRALAVWLLFRLVFSSGVVKIRSGDPTWRNLTALRYHYETQPLPTPLAWYAHRLPAPVHRFCAAALFAIELGASFLLFAPAPFRHAGALLIALLMVVIAATGNYGFFNLLTIALVVPVFDDAALGALVAPLWPSFRLPAAPPPPFGWVIFTGIVGGLLALLSADPVARLFLGRSVRWPAPVARVLGRLDAFGLVHPYGLFAVMTTTRPEIIVEGSRDGVEWLPYEFKWKPGDVRRAPRFVAPHQPRLDWQMWFAALGTSASCPWFVDFVSRLLEGSPDVLALLARNPFPEGPPKYVRALVYEYRFTRFAERRRTGAWWSRELVARYLPPVSLAEASS